MTYDKIFKANTHPTSGGLVPEFSDAHIPGDLSEADAVLTDLEARITEIENAPAVIKYEVDPETETFTVNDSMKEVIISEGVTSIGASCFRQMYGLTDVTLPSTLTAIGNRAFEECTSLAEIEIPASVVTIGNQVFKSCTALTEIEIPASVETIGTNAFNSCSALTDIFIDKPEGSITGVPWGAPETTTITWAG